MIILALLMTLHYIADFLLQTDDQALGKSKRWEPLLAHTTVYSMCFLCFGFEFALITLVLHTITDFITSRIGARLWYIDLYKNHGWEVNHFGTYEYFAHVNMKKRSPFWWMIGFDQLIHLWCLVIAYMVTH